MDMKKMADVTADWLLIVGGLNWGAMAFGQNLVVQLLKLPVVGMIPYNVVIGIVGAAAVWKLGRIFKLIK